MKILEFIIIVLLFLAGCYLFYGLYPETLGKIFEASIFQSFFNFLLK